MKPQKIKRRRTIMRQGYWMGQVLLALCTVFCIVMIWVYAREPLEYAAFPDSSIQEIRGEIADVKRNRSSYQGYPSISYHITLSGDSQPYRIDSVVTEQLRMTNLSIPAGTPVTISYRLAGEQGDPHEIWGLRTDREVYFDVPQYRSMRTRNARGIVIVMSALLLADLSAMAYVKFRCQIV